MQQSHGLFAIAKLLVSTVTLAYMCQNSQRSNSSLYLSETEKGYESEQLSETVQPAVCSDISEVAPDSYIKQ